MKDHHTFLRHVPAKYMLIRWVLISLAFCIITEATLKREAETTVHQKSLKNDIKVPKVYDSPKKTKTFSSGNYKHSHNRIELLREFVLDDFTPYEYAHGDEKTNEKSSGATKNKINIQKADKKINKKTKYVSRRVESRKVIASKENKRENVSKKPKYNSNKWKETLFKDYPDHLRKANLFGTSNGKVKDSNYYHSSEDEVFLSKLKNAEQASSYSTDYPYTYYNNFANGYNLPDEISDINQPTTDNYFLTEKNDYDENVEYGIDYKTGREVDGGEASEIKLKEPKLSNSYRTVETNRHYPTKELRRVNITTTKDYHKKESNKKHGIINATVYTENSDRDLKDYSTNIDDLKYYATKDYYTNGYGGNSKVENNGEIDSEIWSKRPLSDSHLTIKCNGNCNPKISREWKDKGPEVKVPCDKHKNVLNFVEKRLCKYGDIGNLINLDGSQRVLSGSRKNLRKFYPLKKDMVEDLKLRDSKTENTANAAKKGDIDALVSTSNSNVLKNVQNKPTSISMRKNDHEIYLQSKKQEMSNLKPTAQQSITPRFKNTAASGNLKNKVFKKNSLQHTLRYTKYNKREKDDNIKTVFKIPRAISGTLTNSTMGTLYWEPYYNRKISSKTNHIKNINPQKWKNNDRKTLKDTLNWILKGKLFTPKKMHVRSSTLKSKHKLAKIDAKHIVTLRNREKKIVIQQPLPKSGVDLYMFRVSPKSKLTKQTTSGINAQHIALKEKEANDNILDKLEGITEKRKSQKWMENNTKKGNSLLQQMLNIPVKVVVDFFRKYIFGNENPGNMVLKDIWQLPKAGSVTFSKVRKKKNVKISKTSKSHHKNLFNKVILTKISKDRSKQKKMTKKLNAKVTKEANAVSRSFLSNERKSVSNRSNSFIELIDVLLDGRLLDENKESGRYYKKGFLPKSGEGNYTFEENTSPNSGSPLNKLGVQKKSTIISSPYYIPLKRNTGIVSEWKKKNDLVLQNKYLKIDAKRNKINFPEATMTSTLDNLSPKNFPRESEILKREQFKTNVFEIPFLDQKLYQQNQLQTKNKKPYHNKDISSFAYPWDTVGNEYSKGQESKPSSQYANIKDNANTMYNYLNTKKKTKEQNYMQFLTLQDSAHKAPPYTFHIYQGDQTTQGTSYDEIKNIKHENKRHFNKYKGIFGNTDEDLQKSCMNFGKQDFVDFCPRGWVAFKQFCFLLVEEEQRWSDIPDICSRKSGKMAMPKSQEVVAFLVDKLSSKKQYTRPYFVGLRKKDEEWEWIDDTPLSQGLSGEIESNFHSCAVIQEGSLRKMPCTFEAGYICELKRGIEASRVLTVGDSLTKGYFNGGRSFHPYGEKLEELLNKDDHRCFVLEISGKNGEQSAHMLRRLSYYLNTKQQTFNWVLILAGTNDLLMSDIASDTIAGQIVIMHEVVHARGAKSLVITIPELFCERTNCPDVKRRRKLINKHLRLYAAAAESKAYLSDLALKLSLHQLSREDRKAFWEPSGVHLKAKGYDKMSEVIFKDLMESMESPS